jgi:hypothetical protein
MPMKKRSHLLIRLFGGVVVLLACFCDPLEAFHSSMTVTRRLDPVWRSHSAHHQRVLPSHSSSHSSLLAGAGAVPSFDNDDDTISSLPKSACTQPNDGNVPGSPILRTNTHTRQRTSNNTDRRTLLVQWTTRAVVLSSLTTSTILLPVATVAVLPVWI